VWQDDERVRAGELELLHDAFELDRIFLIEHRERVMRKLHATANDCIGELCLRRRERRRLGVPLLIDSIARGAAFEAPELSAAVRLLDPCSSSVGSRLSACDNTLCSFASQSTN
jgi:hypothetical protein